MQYRPSDAYYIYAHDGKAARRNLLMKDAPLGDVSVASGQSHACPIFLLLAPPSPIATTAHLSLRRLEKENNTRGAMTATDPRHVEDYSYKFLH